MTKSSSSGPSRRRSSTSSWPVTAGRATATTSCSRSKTGTLYGSLDRMIEAGPGCHGQYPGPAPHLLEAPGAWPNHAARGNGTAMYKLSARICHYKWQRHTITISALVIFNHRVRSRYPCFCLAVVGRNATRPRRCAHEEVCPLIPSGLLLVHRGRVVLRHRREEARGRPSRLPEMRTDSRISFSFFAAVLLAQLEFAGAQGTTDKISIDSVLAMAKEAAEGEPVASSHVRLRRQVANAIHRLGCDAVFGDYVAKASPLLYPQASEWEPRRFIISGLIESWVGKRHAD
jgi:hypothetical protein